MEARGVDETRAVADRQLEAPATEVGAEGRSGIDEHARADGLEDELSLTDAVDHFHPDAGFALEALDGIGAVGGLAQRCRAVRDELVGVIGLGDRVEPLHDVDRFVHRVVSEDSVPGDDVTEPEHLFLPHERREAPVRPGLNYKKMKRVTAEVEGCDPHP